MAWMLGGMSLLSLALVLACADVEEAEEPEVASLADCETPVEAVEETTPKDPDVTYAPPASPGWPPFVTPVVTFGPTAGASLGTLEPTVDPECWPSPVTNTPSPLTFETAPGGEATPAVEATIPAEAIAEPILVAVGQAACMPDVGCLTVNSVTFHAYRPESDGIDGILVDVTIDNQGGAAISYRPFEFTLIDVDKFAYSTHGGFGSPPLNDGNVPPGLKVRGQLLFDAAEGARVGHLLWDSAAGTIAVSLDGVVEP